MWCGSRRSLVDVQLKWQLRWQQWQRAIKGTFRREGNRLESCLHDPARLTLHRDKEAQPLSWWKVLDVCLRPHQIQVAGVDWPLLVTCAPSAGGNRLSGFHYASVLYVRCVWRAGVGGGHAQPSHHQFCSHWAPFNLGKGPSPWADPRHDT